MMIPRETIDKLNELSILSVAEKLDISVKRKLARCFMHDDRRPSLHFNTDKNTWKCYVCNKGGGAISLVMEKLNLEFVDACKWLADKFNIIIPDDKGFRKAPQKRNTKLTLPKVYDTAKAFDEDVFGWLVKNAGLSETAKKFLFRERKFKEDVIKALNIGSVTYPNKVRDLLLAQFGEERCIEAGVVKRGDYGLYFCFYTPCLLFPYYERDGKLAGVQSRYLGTKENAPRFQFVSSQKTRLFNMPILNTLRRGDRLYISEGITDCIALLCSSHKAVAIPSATILPQEDLVLLKDYDLHMFPDQDEAGQNAFVELRKFFVNQYTTIKAEKLPEGVKDYCQLYITEHGQE